MLVLGLGLESSLSVVWLIWFYSKRGWNRFFVIDFRIKVILIDAIVLEKNELEKESFLDSECHRGSEKHLLDFASYSAHKFFARGSFNDVHHHGA